METLDLDSIKQKSFKGVVALTSRTFLLQIIAFASTFLLTIFLSPTIFGVFYVVSAIISFLGYFSDIGLAAALIQKKEELTRDDLVTTFTIQQVLVVILVIIAFLVSRVISNFYRLDVEGLWLLRALVIAFFLSSLKTIPSIILERKLEFQKLVVPQILETVAFYAVAVTMAWRGMGITSFTWAVVARAVVGLGAIYILSPWRIQFGFSRPVARRLLRYGLPFQANSLLALVKDDLLTVFLGKVLPFAEVGYLGWAKKWAEVPLRLFMDSVVRVTFPAFARLQEARAVMGRAIEHTLFGLSLFIFPITVGLLFFVEPMVTLIPRYEKWQPALLSFFLLALASAVSSLSVPLTNALNAAGKIRITLGLMVMWTVLTWILVVVFIHFFGYQGFAMALLIITATIGVVVYLVKQIAPFSFIRSILYPFLGSIMLAGWFALTRGHGPYDVARLILSGSSGAILYGVFLWLTKKQQLLGFVSQFRKIR